MGKPTAFRHPPVNSFPAQAAAVRVQLDLPAPLAQLEPQAPQGRPAQLVRRAWARPERQDQPEALGSLDRQGLPERASLEQPAPRAVQERPARLAQRERALPAQRGHQA